MLLKPVQGEMIAKCSEFISVSSAVSCEQCCIKIFEPAIFSSRPKLYIPSTLNIDLILWHTQLIVCACSKILNHGLNHGFFLSLFKLISCPIHWIVCVLAYLNFIWDHPFKTSAIFSRFLTPTTLPSAVFSSTKTALKIKYEI